MALNKEVFKTRALTALIFVAVMLVGLLWNGYSFVALFSIIICGCVYEIIKIVKLITPNDWVKHLPIGLIYSLLLIFFIDLGFNKISSSNSAEGNNIFTTYNYILPVGVILSIWINDTMAYLVGSFIGKTPFSKISPKKTWEGTIGGALLCVLIIGMLGYFLPIAQSLAVVHWIAISIICAIFGTLGDLLESKIKRTANIKDSGTFMPGHGGFLDRFDSLLLAAPIVWIYFKVFVL